MAEIAIKGMMKMQKHDLPTANAPDMAARSTEIRMQAQPDHSRREAGA